LTTIGAALTFAQRLGPEKFNHALGLGKEPELKILLTEEGKCVLNGCGLMVKTPESYYCRHRAQRCFNRGFFPDGYDEIATSFRKCS
jgi:hypothetical protein